MSQAPSLGRIVLYTLTDHDADQINRRRSDAREHLAEHQKTANGVQIHVGNGVAAGDEYPLVITRVWGSSPGAAVNGQLLLDGNDTLWVTSTTEGEGPRMWRWPPRV